MKEFCRDFAIEKICGCVLVLPWTGKRFHSERPYHGFVLNDMGVERDYVFSDGTVLHTGGGALFYLPKGSTYEVKEHRGGACFCINFDAQMCGEPLCITPRKYDELHSEFHRTQTAFHRGESYASSLAMRTAYHCVYLIQREEERRYLPKGKQSLLSPAVEYLKEHFTDNAITVRALASLCDMSEVYFRRLFLDIYGTSPKEYIIEKRMAYARTLLLSGDFSVGEVATLVGYGEPCHFSREFTRRVGVSPREFTIKK